MSDRVTLSAAMRSNLLTLQSTSQLINRTQDRLSTGKAIAKATDDAVKFFQAKALTDRAGDLTERKDGIDQGVSTLETVIEATNAIEDLVKQMKGIIDASKSQSASERKEARQQLEELAKQVQHLVDDATYQGLNLLNSTSSKLNVRFSEKSASKLEVNGVDFNASAFYLNTGGTALGVSIGTAVTNFVTELGFSKKLSAYNFTTAGDVASYQSQADTAVKNLERTIANLRSKAATIATNSAILKVRLDFTVEYVNQLQTGGDKLTLADLNEEGANLVALQTRQSLGINALSFAGQAEASVLSLFR